MTDIVETAAEEETVEAATGIELVRGALFDIALDQTVDPNVRVEAAVALLADLRGGET